MTKLTNFLIFVNPVNICVKYRVSNQEYASFIDKKP